MRMKPSGRVLAMAALSIGIFVADTVTNLEIAVAVFYVAVVLLAIGHFRARGVVLVSAGCMALTIVSFLLSKEGAPESGLVNCAISLLAIAATTHLGLKTVAASVAIQEAQAQLARIARVTSLGELTASIAHEINQSLAAITTSGNACMRWLAAQPPNLEKARLGAERIVSDASRASEVILRVRQLAKRAPPHKDWSSLADGIAEIIALTRGEIERHHIALRLRLAQGLPAIRFDKVQIQQVVLNLILNSIEAMKGTAGRPRELTISLEPADQGSVLVAVGDSGVGFGSLQPEQFFDAFYTTKSEGMGMGLAISRSIVEAHGGHIWAEPNPQGGATFRFTLPTAETEAP